MSSLYTPHKPNLSLEDYPHAIAKLRAAIARCNQKIARLEANIDRRKAQFDLAVAEDVDLRNETQRRAAWKEYAFADDEYQTWLKRLRHQQQIRIQHEIKLELLRSSFSVAKLQVRKAIADALVDGEGLALVA